MWFPSHSGANCSETLNEPLRNVVNPRDIPAYEQARPNIRGRWMPAGRVQHAFQTQPILIALVLHMPYRRVAGRHFVATTDIGRCAYTLRFAGIAFSTAAQERP
jgi:hypothetical protein